MKILTADGIPAEVEDSRYLAFDSLRSDHVFSGQFQGRDAGEAMSFLIGQLAYTEAQTFERMYTPMQYEQLVPISYEAGEWATSIRYEISDYAGRGKRSSGKGRDINLVDSGMAEKTFPVFNGNIGYDYSTEELRESSFLRRPLSQTRLMAAMDGYQRHMNDVALNGELGLTGLFNNAVVPQGSAPVGAWLTGPKTPVQILNDINAIIELVWTNTAFNDFPTHIVLPPSCMAYIARTARSDTSDKTILQFVKENNFAKVQGSVDIVFTAGYGLETAGVSATKRMLAYVKSPLRLIYHIPLPLRFLAPQMQGLSVEVPGEYKYSGVEWRYPKSGYYMDGL